MFPRHLNSNCKPEQQGWLKTVMDSSGESSCGRLQNPGKAERKRFKSTTGKITSNEPTRRLMLEFERNQWPVSLRSHLSETAIRPGETPDKLGLAERFARR